MRLKKKYVYSIIELIAVIIITTCIFKFVVIPVRIDGVSMENTLHDQSIALINAIGVKEENVKRFDVVVLYSEQLNEKIIKRVIGMPGDHIEFKNDVLYVNNQKMEQDFLDSDFVENSKITYNVQQFTDDFSVDVGEGEYFVMGDNRLRSTDSRELGTFTIKDILGLKGVVIYPFDAVQWID
ncbi:MAG: signal peptidase I [Longibaculum sp.]